MGAQLSSGGFKFIGGGGAPQKMIFVVNSSLRMGAGKMAAQVGHAAVALYRLALQSDEGRSALDYWARHGEMKIVLRADSASQLSNLCTDAQQHGLIADLIHDAGHTQIPAGSCTVLGIFGPREEIDKVTGHLKLYN